MQLFDFLFILDKIIFAIVGLDGLTKVTPSICLYAYSEKGNPKWWKTSRGRYVGKFRTGVRTLQVGSKMSTLTNGPICLCGKFCVHTIVLNFGGPLV